MRILHCFHNLLGIPAMLAEYQRSQGHHALSLEWNPPRLGHQRADMTLHYSNYEKSRRAHSLCDWIASEKFDIIHVHTVSVPGASSPFETDEEFDEDYGHFHPFNVTWSPPTRLVVTAHGCDVRTFGDSLCEGCDMRDQCEADTTRTQRVKMLCGRAHAITYTTPDLAKFLPDRAVHVPVPYDFSRGRSEDPPGFIRTHDVVFCASNTSRKVGDLLEVVHMLDETGLNYYIPCQGSLTHAEVLRLYRNAYVVIDQIRTGAYGMTSIDAVCEGAMPMAGAHYDHYFGAHIGTYAETDTPRLGKRIAEIVEFAKTERAAPSLKRQYNEAKAIHDLPIIAARYEELYNG